METKNIMIVGVGGQGSLLASKLLGRLLVDEGYDVKYGYGLVNTQALVEKMIEKKVKIMSGNVG